MSNKHINDKYFILFYERTLLSHHRCRRAHQQSLLFLASDCAVLSQNHLSGPSRTGQLLYKSWHVRLCQVAGFAHAPHCVLRERAAAIVFTRVRFIILTLQSLGGPGDLPCCLWRLRESVGRQTTPSNYTVQNRCSVE